MNRMISLIFCMLLSIFITSQALPHCEVPCGIYGDEMRIKMIEEHISTIEKAMKTIADLSKEQPVNYNQLVRWINTKEHHAEEIQHIVFQYFMTQRIKPADATDGDAYAKYVTQLRLLHEMLIAAMKTKQTLDLNHVNHLRSLIKDFETAYFEKHEH